MPLPNVTMTSANRGSAYNRVNEHTSQFSGLLEAGRDCQVRERRREYYIYSPVLAKVELDTNLKTGKVVFFLAETDDRRFTEF